MCSLDMFPSPEESGQRSLRELNQTLEEGLQECLLIDQGKIYPTIEVKKENIIKPSIIDENVENIFIEKDVNLWKRFIHYFKYKGFVSALELIRDYDNVEQINDNYWLKFSQKFSTVLLYLRNLYLTIYVYFFPYALKSNDELCHEFSKSMDWKNGLIRAFEWHPDLHKCAVCVINDCIYIYSANSPFVPLLKHSLQTKVTSLSWRPNREDMLCVGCQSVILIWRIDPNSKQFRPPTECIRIINSHISSPITSISFDTNGDYLIACGPQSSKLSSIKIDSNPEEIKTMRKFGICFTRIFWSPENTRCLINTTSKSIRVFDTKEWTFRKWSQNMTGICQTACWSRPNGRILLFAMRDCTTVFAINFYGSSQPNDVGGEDKCFQVLDLTEHEFPNGVKVGGNIHDMVWDKNSERLAISFKDNSEYIALYKTILRPHLEITPIGFVHGLCGEIPVNISFHYPFGNGSLLTVCWNSGVVSYIPLQYDRNSIKSSHSMSNTPRSLTSFCISSPITKSLQQMSDKSTPLRNSSFIGSPLQLNFTPNDSILSPKRPLLFSTLTKDKSQSVLVK